jgi:hypothetical protein
MRRAIRASRPQQARPHERALPHVVPASDLVVEICGDRMLVDVAYGRSRRAPGADLSHERNHEAVRGDPA